MKTIAFKDKAGGSLHAYFNAKDPRQPRHDRIKEALEDLKHTGNIIIYLVKGNKVRKIAQHQM
jgi:hypothetical protein